MSEMSTRFNFKDVETKWCRFWEDNHIFHAEPNPEKPPYSVVIPPPNVTGILHMGHALNNTLQDIIVRHKRMCGHETCWMPGTDHAGIATQNVVEKQLAKEKKTRYDIGREALLERLWAWKQQYGDTIINQLKKIGSSCDWDRTRFTMDDDYNHAVRHVFVSLYKKGLIYQGQYIINWCPRCQTALSDEEAEHQDHQGSLYYIHYPLKDNPLKHLTVATTRPETMLGDTAVAVNPNDPRYQEFIGTTLLLPIVNREIPVIADEFVNPEFGTGAVKVTPAHDPNDFAMGRRHNLESINVMHPDGRMNDEAGEFSGIDRFEAREAIVEFLGKLKLLEKIAEHSHAVGHCYRCHTVIEPYLSKQWFVRMKPLAEPALKAFEEGKIKFYPDRWSKVYTGWLENIRDWCISRQIWWGHRIPVWHKQVSLTEKNWTDQLLEWGWDSYLDGNWKEDGTVVRIIHTDNGQEVNPQDDRLMPIVKDTEGIYDIYIATVDGKHFEKYGFTQDPDVLDTWFSSWLWPFATFGWPKEHKDTDFFYPTQSLFTASEIIFFWVARMIMAGIEFMGEVPFRDIFIHGTVRDAQGRKMSKSLGNAIDPLEIIDEYGADALRFSLIINSGQDIYISKDKFEIGRNFANKIWNASRLVLMNIQPSVQKENPLNVLDLKNAGLPAQWILSRFQTTLETVNSALEQFRFSEAENAIYDFFWGNFCDWYLELVKPDLEDPNVQKVTFAVLEQSIRLMHPFIPFVTEEVWQHLEISNDSLSHQPWPMVREDYKNQTAETQMRTFMELTSVLRNIRAQWNIKPNQKITCVITADAPELESISEMREKLQSMAGIEKLELSTETPPMKDSASGVVGTLKFFVPLNGIIDIHQEKLRMRQECGEFQNAYQGIQKRLSNTQFLAKAPQDVVEKDKTRLNQLTEKIKALEDVLSTLG